jgi:hypothetical protein
MESFLLSLLGALGSLLLVAAQVKPEDAASNLSAWSKKLKIRRVPRWIKSPSADNWASVIAVVSILVGLLGVLLLWYFYPSTRTWWSYLGVATALLVLALYGYWKYEPPIIPEEHVRVIEYSVDLDELDSQQRIVFALKISNDLNGNIFFGRDWVGPMIYDDTGQALHGGYAPSEDHRGVVILTKETRKISIIQRLPKDVAELVSKNLEAGQSQSFNWAGVDVSFIYKGSSYKLSTWPGVVISKGEHGVLQVDRSSYANVSMGT